MALSVCYYVSMTGDQTSREIGPVHPSQEIASVLSTLGEDQGFDSETCDEIAQMPFEDAFETAYTYLISAGLDPDDLLRQFMETPSDE
jgi:DNA polymerase III delta subunit